MNNLAATLLTLPTYPCAPKPDRDAAIELEADLFAISVIRRFGVDEENKGELRELVQDIFRRVESAWLLFENVAPQLSSVRRLQMIVGALATGLYSRTYAELVQRGDTDLISPRSLRTMFDFDAQSSHGFDEGVEGSFRIVAELMVAIEQADAWSNVLFRREEADSRALDEGQ
ncbi:hypothetical protein [Brachybacterium paraconglomeratum]|uniref:hypothetical protein n=1 Tax=Brachybacterium paraconglomeratum TaxID=173362 RepID=UPI0022AF7543|nr:hypothetical protein [Brachybacterium paraconglomeratum]MCZ4328127.1 hypothetical protein [Brachybacterium paraconglomeratum]